MNLQTGGEEKSSDCSLLDGASPPSQVSSGYKVKALKRCVQRYLCACAAHVNMTVLRIMGV